MKTSKNPGSLINAYELSFKTLMHTIKPSLNIPWDDRFIEYETHPDYYKGFARLAHDDACFVIATTSETIYHWPHSSFYYVISPIGVGWIESSIK